MSPAWITVDGNDACASVAYRLSDVIAIYPTTHADLATFTALESRVQITAQQDPDRYQHLLGQAREQIDRRLALHRELASVGAGHQGGAPSTRNGGVS